MTARMSTRNRDFHRALIAGTFAAVAVGVTLAPALADTLGYYYEEAPTTVYTPGPTTTATTTYTYTYPAPPPAPVYTRERGPGIYLDTPILNFGIGVH